MTYRNDCDVFSYSTTPTNAHEFSINYHKIQFTLHRGRMNSVTIRADRHLHKSHDIEEKSVDLISPYDTIGTRGKDRFIDYISCPLQIVNNTLNHQMKNKREDSSIARKIQDKEGASELIELFDKLVSKNAIDLQEYESALIRKYLIQPNYRNFQDIEVTARRLLIFDYYDDTNDELQRFYEELEKEIIRNCAIKDLSVSDQLTRLLC